RPAVEIERIRAAQTALVLRVGQETREVGGFHLGGHGDHDRASRGAHRGAHGDLRLEPLNLSPDNETGDALNDQAVRAVILDVTPEHDPRFLALDDQSSPALTPAGGEELPVADAEPDRAALDIEEAGVDRDDRRVRRRDLLDGPTHGGSAGPDQTK